jgi:hypothetical protein
MRIRLCASNRRHLSSPRRCRIARFSSAFFEVGSGDSGSDAESVISGLAICAESSKSEGLRPESCRHRGWGESAVGARRVGKGGASGSPLGGSVRRIAQICRVLRRGATSSGRGEDAHTAAAAAEAG